MLIYTDVYAMSPRENIPLPNTFKYKLPIGLNISDHYFDFIHESTCELDLVMAKTVHEIPRQVFQKTIDKSLNFNPLNLIREQTLFYHLYRFYVSRYGFIFDEKYYPLVNRYTPKKVHISTAMEGYDKAIIGYSYHYEYGHFVMDMLAGIVLIPQEYFKDACILVPFNQKAARTYIGLLGYDSTKVFSIKEKFFYVTEAHMIVSTEGVCSLLVKGLPTIREKFFRNLKMESIKPTKYYALNRKNGLWGRIDNMDDIIDIINKKFTDIVVERIPDKMPYNVAEFARMLASAKFIIFPAGSIVMNSIFMHEKTAILILGSSTLDYPDLSVGFALDIWMLYLDGKFTHGVETDIKFSITLALNGFKQLHYALEHGMWQEKVVDDYQVPYNLETMLKLAQTEVDVYNRENNENIKIPVTIQ